MTPDGPPSSAGRGPRCSLALHGVLPQWSGERFGAAGLAHYRKRGILSSMQITIMKTFSFKAKFLATVFLRDTSFRKRSWVSVISSRITLLSLYGAGKNLQIAFHKILFSKEAW